MESWCLTTATNQSEPSLAPGIIPEPAHVNSDAAPPTPAIEKAHTPKPGRPNVLRIAVAKLMSALRGDKYMIDAYPPARHEDAAASDAGESRAPTRWAVRALSVKASGLLEDAIVAA